MSEHPRRFSTGVAILAIALLVGLLDWQASGSPPDLLDHGWDEVQQGWRQGKVVLLIRHTERCDRSDDPCLEGEKGITLAGGRTARKLGKAIASHLEPRQALFYHSPVKRTAQTARLLFGELSRKAPWLRRNCKTRMLGAILAHKEPGRNLVLVTHASCMKHLAQPDGRPLIDESTLDDQGYGISWFAMKEGKGLRPLGYLLPDEWRQLSKEE